MIENVSWGVMGDERIMPLETGLSFGLWIMLAVVIAAVAAVLIVIIIYSTKRKEREPDPLMRSVGITLAIVLVMLLYMVFGEEKGKAFWDKYWWVALVFGGLVFAFYIWVSRKRAYKSYAELKTIAVEFAKKEWGLERVREASEVHYLRGHKLSKSPFSDEPVIGFNVDGLDTFHNRVKIIIGLNPYDGYPLQSRVAPSMKEQTDLFDVPIESKIRRVMQEFETVGEVNDEEVQAAK